MRGLEERLSERSSAPLAVAFSGGGDSLALLLIAAHWAGRRGRRLVALHVDHGLRPESRSWAQACIARAAALGLDCQILAWTGDKPPTGLPAAARRARHKLLADAARGLGARVVLMGHTASDLAEAAGMRAEGSSVPDPREWSPSPAWPEGRGVYLFRPLLGRTRAELRAWLTERGETWIDDPANEDLRFARARARAAATAVPFPRVAGQSSSYRGREVRSTPGGGLELPRRDLTPAEVAAACVCAAGGERPPRRDRVEALWARLAGEEALTATLAGARIEADMNCVRFLREPGEAARGGLQPVTVRAGRTAVWDGRFEIASDAPVTVRAARGLVGKLPLSTIPAAERGAYPVLVDTGGQIRPATQARALALDRFRAAMGFVDREPD